MEKEAMELELTRLLEIFKTDNVSENDIIRETELVRNRLYEQAGNNNNTTIIPNS